MIAIAFWVACVILGIIEIALVENAAIGWATIILIVVGVVGDNLGITAIWPYIQHNPLTVLWLFLGYLVAGTVYSVIKWTSYVYAEAAKLQEKRDLYPNQSFNPSIYKPSASENKDKIVAWMAYWPFSAIWTIINDPIRRSFNFIYNQLSSFLQSISDRAFARFQPAPPKVGD